MNNDEAWWRSAFADDYLDVYAHRDDAAAAAEVVGLLPRLRAAGGPVLDVGCGGGRHLDALRRQGIDAFGCDFSADLVARAAGRERCRGALLRCDMRAPALAPGWGAVLLLFTAFGYFDDAGNRACLTALGRLLRSGGWLVLDLPEPQRLRAGLVPESTRRTPAGLEIREQRSLCGNRVEKAVAIVRGGCVLRSYRESIQLYDRPALAALAGECGLVLNDCWPGLRGPQEDEARLVAWMRKGVG